jgi:hypothetical protein
MRFNEGGFFAGPIFGVRLGKSQSPRNATGSLSCVFFGFVVVVVVVVLVVGRHLRRESSAQLKGWSGFSFSE